MDRRKAQDLEVIVKIKEMDKRLTILLDLDGVVAQYPFEKGQEYDPSKMGEPIPGAVEAVKRLAKHYRIVMFTTRKREVAEPWLKRHGIPFDDWVEKPLNFLIIDDRALTFRGNWKETLCEIGQFRPWHKSKKENP